MSQQLFTKIWEIANTALQPYIFWTILMFAVSKYQKVEDYPWVETWTYKCHLGVTYLLMYVWPVLFWQKYIKPFQSLENLIVHIFVFRKLVNFQLIVQMAWYVRMINVYPALKVINVLLEVTVKTVLVRKKSQSALNHQIVHRYQT